MEANSSEMAVEVPSYDIEEIQIKNEPIEYLSENEEQIEEAFNQSLKEGDFEMEKDIDPFNFLKMQFTAAADGTAIDPSLTYTGKPKKYTCDICFNVYVDLKSIRRHLLRIHNINPPEGTALYECPDCLQRFSDKSHLSRHMLSHSGVKPHVCTKCSKGFGRKEHLVRHLATVKCDEVRAKKEVVPKKEKPAKCKTEVMEREIVRDERVQEVGILTIVKVETAPMDFPRCEICSKKFVHQSHLQVHMKTHDVQPTKFQCPICGKSLSRKSHLNHHIRRLHETKNEENPEVQLLPEEVTCTLCPKKFTEQLAYERHQAMHSNSQIKKEICDICEHVFLSKWHVRKHKLHKHNIEPENGCLACVYCQKKFIDNYYLKRHYLTRHKNEPFPYENSFNVVTKEESAALQVKEEPVMEEEYLEEAQELL